MRGEFIQLNVVGTLFERMGISPEQQPPSWVERILLAPTIVLAILGLASVLVWIWLTKRR